MLCQRSSAAARQRGSGPGRRLGTVRIAELRGDLAGIVGVAHVLTDPDVVAGHVTDWTGHWRGHTAAVVRPATTDEVSRVLALCHRDGVAVVPQGGNTGLVGGSVPHDGEVVLSTTRLNRIEEVDPLGCTIAAGAGVRVADAQRAAAGHGLALGVDLASRDSATLGGIVATNAGGIAVVKHGSTRAQVLGIEAVLADGRVLTRWTALPKDNIGYDLPGLLTGSEGTLAVITRVLLRLVFPARATATVLAGVDDLATALVLRDAIFEAGLTLEAAELMTDDGLHLVCAEQDLRYPFGERPAYAVLLEVSGSDDPADALVEVVAQCSGIVDGTVDIGHSERLWHYRESHTESAATASTTPVLKLDISVPVRSIGAFLADLTALVRTDHPGIRLLNFGHFADGNIHVNLLDVAPERREEVTDAVFRLVAAHAGSISAEHGIGRAKNPWIVLGRSPVDRELMAAIRRAFDPAGILNPHVLRFD